MNHSSFPRRWDGSRTGHRPYRLLRLAPDTRARALRAPQSKPCARCGNRVEWYDRDDGRPVPLHPHELPAEQVPEGMRWHVFDGIAHPVPDGSAWCRVPHLPLCPATAEPAAARLGRLTGLRRHLAVATRQRIDNGLFTPPPTLSGPEPDAPQREVVLLLHVLYLAPSRVEAIRCVAQTRRRGRCPHPVAASGAGTGVWAAHPVPPAPARDHLTGHQVGTLMLIYDVSRLPYGEQVRWRQQHCPDHAATLAADVELPAWEPFDAFAHHQHITPAPENRATCPRDGDG